MPIILKPMQHPGFLSRVVLCSAAIALGACAQTASYAPEPIRAGYSIQNFSRSNLTVVVRDLRADRESSAELVSAIQSQILNSLADNPKKNGMYLLSIDIVEHRSFFTLGNWNAVTRLRWQIRRPGGTILTQGTALGEGQSLKCVGIRYRPGRVPRCLQQRNFRSLIIAFGCVLTTDP
jgi:hypothetical protein